jgi:hypothetical protein
MMQRNPEKREFAEIDDLMKKARVYFFKRYHPDNKETGNAKKFMEIYDMFEKNNFVEIYRTLLKELPRGDLNVDKLFVKKHPIPTPEKPKPETSRIDFDQPPVTREIPLTKPMKPNGIHRMEPSEDFSGKSPIKDTENKTPEKQLPTEAELEEIQAAQGRAFTGPETIESEDFELRPLENIKTDEAQPEPEYSPEAFQAAQGRAFTGPETIESSDFESGNITAEDLEKLKDYLDYQNQDELTPTKTDSSDYFEIKEEEPQPVPAENEPAPPEPIISPESEKEISVEAEEPAVSPEIMNAKPIEPEKTEEIPTPQEQPADLEKMAENINRSMEASREAKIEQEKNPLEKKNELIRKYKDVILSYMKTRERAIQLQEQIKEDNKVLARFKRFLTGMPKTNIMEDYKKSYLSLKAKETEIEEKTGVSPKDLIRLWEQYKQSKEKQRLMQEKAEEEKLFENKR